MIKGLTIAALTAATIAGALPAKAEDGHFVPVLSYRTGPYAPGGIPFADGYIDYFHMLNHRDGGVNGVPFITEECETGYKTDRGVECFDRLKDNHGGAIVVSPWSTGTTYALIEKATASEIPILSMGYGRTSAADGRVFPYVFNFPSTYWNQATAIVQYIANQEGGLDKLKGKRFGFVYLDHPYGKEPIPTFDLLSEKFGFDYDKYPIAPASMTEQKSTWLQVRKTRPSYVIMWGWGAMNATAIKEASSVRFKLDHFIGNWWSASEGDLRPVGKAATGYKGATFHGTGTDFPVYKDLQALHAAGKGVGSETAGEVLYNRGVVNAAYVAEAVRIAQDHFGKKQLSGKEVRWGLENLDIDKARVAELGMTGLMPPLTVSCDNHEGAAPAIRVQQWDGEKWNMVSDWIPAMTEITRPLIEQDAAQYAKEAGITPRSCS